MTSSILKANLRTKFAALAGGVLSALLAHGAITVNMASPSSGDGVTLEGSVVALTRDGGTYRLSGTTGSYAVRCDADLTLEFDDTLNITSPSDSLPALDLNGHAVTVVSNGKDSQDAKLYSRNSKSSSRGTIEVNEGAALAAVVADEASAKKLLAAIRPSYETCPVAATKIAAVSQWVMLPDPWRDDAGEVRQPQGPPRTASKTSIVGRKQAPVVALGPARGMTRWSQ